MTDTDNAVLRYLQRTGHRCISPRAALCDMDGTLYDSMPRHAEAWRAMMATQGLDIPIERFFEYEGRTGDATIDILFREFLGRPATPDECRDLYAVKSANFRRFQESEGIHVMPGAQSLISQFLAEGIVPVLVTGSGQSSLLNVVTDHFPGAFSPDTRVTAHDVQHGKPHPEPYLKALELARVTADEAFVLENAPLGVESGHAAGIFTIAVATGPLPLKMLADAGADIVFESMPQAAEAFPRLLSSMRNVRNPQC